MPLPTRRQFVTLLGGAAGVGLLPLNFRCTGTSGRIVGSSYRPTPEAPLTPADQFYINYNYALPSDLPPPSRWRLRVDGLVRRPLELGFDDLLRFEQVTREITLECVGNTPGGGLISSGAFTGARLRDVLAAAGLDPRAGGLNFLGLDGFPAYLPASVGREDGSLIVHALNGEPLTAEHGAPVRVLHPGRHGMFSIKWLDSVTATRDYHSYGSLRGLGRFVEGTTAPRSRIDSLRDGRRVALGEPVDVTGIAVTAGVGVARVEVQADGAWHDAELTFNTLTDERSPFLWSLWRFRWTPRRAGAQTLGVRAYDAAGRTQSASAEFPYDSGAVHSLRVVVQ